MDGVRFELITMCLLIQHRNNRKIVSHSMLGNSFSRIIAVKKNAFVDEAEGFIFTII